MLAKCGVSYIFKGCWYDDPLNMCIVWVVFKVNVVSSGENFFQVLISSKLDSQRCALIDNVCVMLWVGRRTNQATWCVRSRSMNFLIWLSVEIVCVVCVLCSLYVYVTLWIVCSDKCGFYQCQYILHCLTSVMLDPFFVNANIKILKWNVNLRKSLILRNLLKVLSVIFIFIALKCSYPMPFGKDKNL